MRGQTTEALAPSLSVATVFVLRLSIHLESCDEARFPSAQEPASRHFIRTSCSTTTYPALCFNSLSSYEGTIKTNPKQLAHTALSVTLNSARSTSTAMKMMSKSGGMSCRVAAAMADCMDTMGDSLDKLKQSMEAMAHLQGKIFGFQLNSSQTWVRAALTDDDTCMGGFSGNSMNGEVKIAMRSHVVNVAQLTSDALSLINGLTTAHSSP